jgi:hypothetical protein
MRKPTTFIAVAMLMASSVAAFADGTPSTKDTPAPATPVFDIAFGGYVASDYVFRGISQSARWPSGSTYVELRYDAIKDVQLYGGLSIESIDYPNRAAAEVDFYGGVRPTFGKLVLDFGYWYYWYPGGRDFDGGLPAPLASTALGAPNPNCTNGRYGFNASCNVYEADLSFWEVYGKATYPVTDALAAGANVFYSPSWLNEGADGLYASGTLKYTIPSDALARVLPKAVGAFVSGELGHYWFGQTGAFYGNIDLPEYTTWNVGAAFTYKVFTLDFRYYDTDLSKSNCDVLTSDHTATASASNITPINPSGLGSNWCGAAFVAKLSIDLTANTNLK